MGNKRAANMVILGAALPLLGMDIQLFQDSINSIFGRKGDEIVKMNIDALQAGIDFTNKKGSRQL
jgi:indolepyruvate ferredoxin oxidoreductase beta subunit